MKSYLDLASIFAKVHKRQNRMSLICIILAVFLVTVIFGMADMFIRSEKMQAYKDDGNWHVIFKKIEEQDAKLIAARPEIEASSWYSVLNYRGQDGYTLSGKKTAICGLDESMLGNLFPGTTITEGKYPAGDNEALLSENAKTVLNIQIGDSFTVDVEGGEPLEFVVSGFVSNSAMLMKEDFFGVFLSMQEFQEIYPGVTAGKPADYDSVFYVRFSTKCNIQKAISDIAAQYHLSNDQISQNIKVLGMLGQSKDPFMLQIYGSAFALFLLVMTAGILMITSSLNSNVAQRTEFFGMMRCIGATPKQIMRLVRREALGWCKLAIPVGVLLGVVSVWILCAFLRYLSPNYFGEMPAFDVSAIGIVSGVILGLLTVLLAARSPAKRAARVSPLTAVSGNANASTPVRRAAHTGLLKVDTALGIHHATSNKKNFLLMVGSFSLSIILFLSFSATLDFSEHAITPLKPWTPDLSIITPDNTCSIDPALLTTFQGNPAIERVYGRMFAYDVPIEVNGQSMLIDLVSYEEHQFNWAKDTLLEGSLESIEQDPGAALIVHQTQRFLQVGDTVDVDYEGMSNKLHIVGELSISPFTSTAGKGTVICSEATFRQLTAQANYTIIDIQLSKAATEADVNAIRQQAGSAFTFSDRRSSNDETRGIYYAFTLFVYGFLVFIALIAVFNIVNSISMSVSARMKQYGALRAIGMSDYQLIKMIAAETASYALVGCVVGCAFGLPLHQFLFSKLVTFHWGDPWSVPIEMLVIIVAIVILSAMFAVYGPAKRIQKMSIVDTISAL